MHGPRATSQTQHLLALPPTLTLDNNGRPTRIVRARLPHVTRIATRMVTVLSPVGAGLLADIDWVGETLASVARSLAFVHTTGEVFTAGTTTGDLSEMTGDVEPHL